MTQPKVTIEELDGSLGILPSSEGRLYAVAGVCSSGPVATPAAFARVQDITSNFGAGPAVEAAAHYIEKRGRPVLFTRTAAGASDTGDVSSVASTATGTSVVTIASSPTPNDDYELVLYFVTGGTRGTAGITYKLSLDGGETYGAVTALGTATSITVPGAGGVTFSLGVGTVVAGDYHTARTTAPNWDSTTIAAALTALQNSVQDWEICHVVGPVESGGAFDAIENKFAAMFAAGKRKVWIGNCRTPDLGESEAAYLTAITTALGSKTTKQGALAYGACKMPSSVSGRQYRRPTAFWYAALEGSVSEEVNTADVSRGAITGVSIADANGNPSEHDESIYPGADDARFVTARTHTKYPGVYVNRPRLYSSDGSDFQLMPHRRVLNLFHDTLDEYFTFRLNKPVLVDRNTGFILEAEALEIEQGALSLCRARLLTKPKASNVLFTLGRRDNLLSTKTMTGDGRLLPLSYPEFINLSVGFYNPALTVQPV